MSEYLSKKAVLEWLDDRRYKSPWIESFRERLESGAFDVDESEGTWKATSEFAFRLNDHLDAEVQRLRAAINEMRDAIWGEYVPIKVVTKINKIASEALSTTSEPTGAERAKAAIADRYKNALHGWHNPVDRAAGSYYNGYLNGVWDTLRLLDIIIPGINAPEKEGRTE